MGITRCVDDCLGIETSVLCHELWGCLWRNHTEGVQEGCASTSGGLGEGGTLWVGVFLSLIGDIIINVGMNCMKHAHNVNIDKDGTPIKHFVCVPWWWAGVLGIMGGELANIVAYGYAPASIVTPMGAVGVLTNVLITTYALKEPFRRIQIVGVCILIAGIVIVVFYAPATNIRIQSNTIWEDWVFTMQFAVYMGLFVLILPTFLFLGTKYGEKWVLIHMTTCAVIASLTIVCAKTFSSLLASALEFGFARDWAAPAPYVALTLMVVTAILSMSYVNKAMMAFGNSVVVPTYYALFTCVSVGSVAWVYREFDCLKEPLQIFLFLLGLVFTISGVILLQFTGVQAKKEESKEVVREGEEGNNMDDFRSVRSNTDTDLLLGNHRMSAVWGSGMTGAALVYDVPSVTRAAGGGFSPSVSHAPSRVASSVLSQVTSPLQGNSDWPRTASDLGGAQLGEFHWSRQHSCTSSFKSRVSDCDFGGESILECTVAHLDMQQSRGSPMSVQSLVKSKFLHNKKNSSSFRSMPLVPILPVVNIPACQKHEQCRRVSWIQRLDCAFSSHQTVHPNEMIIFSHRSPSRESNAGIGHEHEDGV